MNIAPEAKITDGKDKGTEVARSNKADNGLVIKA